MTRKQSLDADLLAAVPDADAVRVLYERHVDAVFRFAVRRCRSPEDVADLVSAVFVELLSAAASYDRRRDEVRVWLLGIAARCLADQRRADYRRSEQSSKTRFWQMQPCCATAIRCRRPSAGHLHSGAGQASSSGDWLPG